MAVEVFRLPCGYKQVGFHTFAFTVLGVADGLDEGL